MLGLNGAGKSTLLRIMAGVDEDYLGETALSKGYTRGLLEQEPQLDPSKTVRQVVEEAVQPVVDLLRRYDEINERFATVEPDAMDALLEEQARVQEEIEKHDAWTLDRPVGTGDGRAALPARRHAGVGAFRRRAAARGAVPPAADRARHPAAG